MTINMELARKLFRSNDEIKMIKHYQAMCNSFANDMKTEDDPETLKLLSNLWTKYQFKLQEQWGFDKNPAYHKFWELPKCGCPKYDNEDAYPHMQFINQDCILHSK